MIFFFIWGDKAILSLSSQIKQKYQKWIINWKPSEVRGVGTIFDTCLNLGHLFLYKFKNLYGHSHTNLFSKNYAFQISCIVSDFLLSSLKYAWSFCHSEPILHGENVNVNKVYFDVNHRYSIQLYIQLYCTIVKEQTVYPWILFDFSFDDDSGSPTSHWCSKRF